MGAAYLWASTLLEGTRSLGTCGWTLWRSGTVVKGAISPQETPGTA